METRIRLSPTAARLARSGAGDSVGRLGIQALKETAPTSPITPPLPKDRAWVHSRDMKLIGVIPARYASTRFPGKPLHPIAGIPLIQRVVERCRLSPALSEVIVATDDERIAAFARGFCRVEMTRDDHPSGTDRIAEVASRVPADGYINIRAMNPSWIRPSLMPWPRRCATAT